MNFPSENNSNMATKKFELLAKHVKSLQFVIAIACWAVVIEKDQTNEEGLYTLLEKLYLGKLLKWRNFEKLILNNFEKLEL